MPTTYSYNIYSAINTESCPVGPHVLMASRKDRRHCPAWRMMGALCFISCSLIRTKWKGDPPHSPQWTLNWLNSWAVACPDGAAGKYSLVLYSPIAEQPKVPVKRLTKSKLWIGLPCSLPTFWWLLRFMVWVNSNATILSQLQSR